MSMQFWLNFITSFLIVVAVLMVGAGIHEYVTWKKGSSK